MIPPDPARICECGHPASHHPTHADGERHACLGHAFSPATGDELKLSVCPCNQFRPAVADVAA